MQTVYVLVIDYACRWAITVHETQKQAENEFIRYLFENFPDYAFFGPHNFNLVGNYLCETSEYIDFQISEQAVNKESNK